MTAATRARVMFWALVIAGWAAVLAVGGTWIHRHPRQGTTAASSSTEPGCLKPAAKRQMAGFTAIRPLARNHLIRQEDLDWTSANGGLHPSRVLDHYSQCPIEVGQRVIETEIASMPTIEVPAGRVSHPFALDGHARAARAINAGTVLDIFDGPSVAARNAGVLALECPTGSTERCVAILSVAPDDLRRLNALDAKTALLVKTAKP